MTSKIRKKSRYSKSSPKTTIKPVLKQRERKTIQRKETATKGRMLS